VYLSDFTANTFLVGIAEYQFSQSTSCMEKFDSKQKLIDRKKLLIA
jgi:hypothetical protein